MSAHCKACGCDLLENFMERAWEHFEPGCEFSAASHPWADNIGYVWSRAAEFAVVEQP